MLMNKLETLGILGQYIQLLSIKMGDHSMQIRSITNIDQQMPKEYNIAELKQHNAPIDSMDMRLVAVIGKNYRNCTTMTL